MDDQTREAWLAEIQLCSTKAALCEVNCSILGEWARLHITGMEKDLLRGFVHLRERELDEQFARDHLTELWSINKTYMGV